MPIIIWQRGINYSFFINKQHGMQKTVIVPRHHTSKTVWTETEKLGEWSAPVRFIQDFARIRF